MRFYGSFSKVNQEERTVSGYASTEAVDEVGERILKSGIEEALADYMKFANIREMHEPSAVGIASDAFVDDKGLYITAKVVDSQAWEKVTAGVYKGFSVGGRVLKRNDTDRRVIEKMRLCEISLVDRPCNPEAVFDVYKAIDADEIGEDMTVKEKTAGVEEVILEKSVDDKATEELVVVETATETVEKVVDEVVAEETVDPVAKADALLSEIEASLKSVEGEEVQKSADEMMAELNTMIEGLNSKLDSFEAQLAEKEVEKAALAEKIDTLTKAASVKEEALTDKGEFIAKFADRTSAAIETLTKRLDEQKEAFEKRLEEVRAEAMLMPAPAKTLGPGAGIAGVVEKGADAAGVPVSDKRTELSDEEIGKALASMSPNDQALALIKSALKFPRQIAVR